MVFMTVWCVYIGVGRRAPIKVCAALAARRYCIRPFGTSPVQDGDFVSKAGKSINGIAHVLLPNEKLINQASGADPCVILPNGVCDVLLSCRKCTPRISTRKSVHLLYGPVTGPKCCLKRIAGRERHSTAVRFDPEWMDSCASPFYHRHGLGA